MSTEWYGDAMLEAMKLKAAEGLLAAAVLYSNQLRLRVATPSPFYTVARTRTTVAGKKGSTYKVYYDPSKRGEYPKLRTGAGQKAITWQPASAADVMRTGYVRVGYVYGNHHLLSLELDQDRKGLIDLLDEMRPQLAALATGAFKGS
jgi:hypothetical protein